MHQISFSYEVQHSIDAPLSAVFAFLADVNNIIACSSGVERTDIVDARTVKWNLTRQEQFGLSFAPEYTLRYDFTPDHSIAWHTLDGNVAVRAQLTLTALSANRTSVTATEEVQFPLPISPIMAKIVSAFARTETRNETLQWLKRAAARLDRAFPESPVRIEV